MALLSASAVLSLALQCAPAVHPQTITTIVKTESGFNPWAIGVVGRVLPKQPQSLEEALEVISTLVADGANFSVGLGQINRYNFDISKPELAFEPCNNLRMAATNLQSCYERMGTKGEPSQATLLKAISCYYSGNKTRGFKPEPQFGGTSHVQRVIANADAYKVPAISGEAYSPPVDHARQVAPQPQPTYQSWDVLRQYPRFTPATQTSPQAPNPQPHETDTQENTDA